ncbi:aspartyl-tRNA synthetase [Purpureocillium lavendulum]|uniref:Aspartyl-tRNA synthetase n=1 Tax=Purpureocillium lavendulum TaxID=1247861 RepID=A0AB34FG96_9HYPO|nr:aspartyl-tRNA synthetase [Purpureocillium lavendulum]
MAESAASLGSSRSNMSADWPTHPHELNTIAELDRLPRGTKVNFQSLVYVNGILKIPPEPIRSATLSEVEVCIKSIYLVSAASNTPFTNYKPPESLRNRMKSRILDLRYPSNQALFRIRTVVARTFRDTLERRGFVEVNTPKL